MPEKKDKYEQLTVDLKKALEAGRHAEELNPEDGGTCNFDSPAIMLPRWVEKKVQEAAKNAGTHCYKWNLYHNSYFVFRPDSKGQGNARSRNSEAMTKTLQDLGYDAFEYCQAD